MTVLQDYCRLFETMSPENRQRLPAIEWLLSEREDVRRSGRSTLMAMAFMRAASEGRTTSVFDHYLGTIKDSRARIIQMIRSAFPSLGYRMNLDGGLTVEPKARFQPIQTSTVRHDELVNVMEDFRAVVRLLLRSGARPDDLIRVVRESVAKIVMES